MATAEHILLEGDALDGDAEASHERKAQQHFHVVNRAHALQTEMILFEGGWLSVRQHRRNKPGEARMINLRYVDPRPSISRYFAKRTLMLAAGLGLAGVLAAILAWFSISIVVTIPAMILLFTGAAIAFAMCTYRTRKDVVFYTRSGRAAVIELMATLGSFRSLRKTLPQLIAAIEKTPEPETDPKKRLRSEMREHYRLRECGILSGEQCSASTQRILRHFK